jgi:hypothetical protein
MTIRSRLRRLMNPPGDPVVDLSPEPVSRTFGFDRGTPIDRFYIDSFLRQRREHIRGKTLEIAGSEYTQRYGSTGVESLELHTQPSDRPNTFVGDLTQLNTLPSAQVDCFICTQTFNFIYDYRSAILGAHHMLVPGGWLLATVGGVSQISRFDMDRWGDYWRFSSATCERLFAEFFKEVEVVTFGNFLAAASLLRGLAVEDLASVDLLDPVDPDYQVIIGIAARKSS